MILDDLNQMKKLDPGRALDSICSFPEQLKQVWQASQNLEIPETYKKAKKIVLAGMGGSALAGKIVQSLLADELKIPFEVVTEYDLPGFVDEETLVILSSYSGNTEETLSVLKKAKEKGAMIFPVTTGGKMADEIKKGTPGMIFSPYLNFLGYPKTAIGYSLGSLIGFLTQAEYINFTRQEIDEQINEFSQFQHNLLPTSSFKENQAKQIAAFLVDKIGILITSEHLKGAGVAVRNQINEIAHSLCVFFDLPEMNHHLVEAFANPKGNKNNLGVVFIKSEVFSARNKLRYEITQELLKKMKIKAYEYQVSTSKIVAQALEIVQLGGFVSCYLSFLNKQDPGPESWILDLKEKLAAHAKQ